MFSSIISAVISGVSCIPVKVEADVSNGLPLFSMVGYLSSRVKEAQERVRTALKNTGFSFPARRITVNLSPADIRKEGTGFDLPIAAALLCAFGSLEAEQVRDICMVGIESEWRGKRGTGDFAHCGYCSKGRVPSLHYSPGKFKGDRVS